VDENQTTMADAESLDKQPEATPPGGCPEPMEAQFEHVNHWENVTVCGITRTDVIWAALACAVACLLGWRWEWAVVAFAAAAGIRGLAAHTD